MTDTPPETPPREGKPRVTGDNLRDGYKVTAPFVNKSVITAFGGGQQARITLFETYTDANLQADITEARVAFVMPIGDLMALRDLLTNFEKNNLQSFTLRIGPDGKPMLDTPEEGNG